MVKNSMLVNYLILPIYLITMFLFCSLDSLFTSWFFLELNTISFMILMSYLNKDTDCTFKYFLIQVVSSSILMLSLMFFINLTDLNLNYFMKILFNLSLLMKLGMVPFHSWYLHLIKKLNWLMYFLLTVNQKFLPLLMLSYLYEEKILILVSLLTLLVTLLFSLNSFDLRLILGYSSFNHLTWVIMMIMLDSNMWLTYFMFYFFINLNIILYLNYYKIYKMNNLFFFNSILKFFFIFSIFTLMGFPFTSGFFIKVNYMEIFEFNSLSMMLMLMFMVSTTMFLVYMRLMFYSLFNYSVISKRLLNLKKFNIFKFKFSLYMLNFFLFLTILIFFFFS
nr:NADH deshydrogenase subunit 2 [Euceros serricornis]